MDIDKMERCARLLPPPGEEVVVELITEIRRLKHLLAIAKCPQCDGSGAYHSNDSVVWQTSGGMEQCQWCYEVERS